MVMGCYEWLQMGTGGYVFLQLVKDYGWLQVVRGGCGDYRWLRVIKSDYRWLGVIMGGYGWLGVTDYRWLWVGGG